MTWRIAVAALLLGPGPWVGPARAEVYTWVDQDGTVHYSAEPPPHGQRAGKVRSLDVDVEPAPADDAAPAPPASGATSPTGANAAPPGPVAARVQPRPRPTPSVVLYTTSWCPWCKKAKAYFRSRGIAFTERDIEADPGALERKLGLDRDRRVPTAVIGDTVVRGYSPAGYQAALQQP
jgi:glutaredoxin